MLDLCVHLVARASAMARLWRYSRSTLSPKRPILLEAIPGRCGQRGFTAKSIACHRMPAGEGHGPLESKVAEPCQRHSRLLGYVPRGWT